MIVNGTIHCESVELYLALRRTTLTDKPLRGVEEVTRSLRYIQTGVLDALDADFDELFYQILSEQPNAKAYCSHCYAHFTPTEKPFDVHPSKSCTLSFPRNNPELFEEVKLSSQEYRRRYGVIDTVDYEGPYDPGAAIYPTKGY
jgi:hypothetical protein